jgi:hypothetical protein
MDETLQDYIENIRLAREDYDQAFRDYLHVRMFHWGQKQRDKASGALDSARENVRTALRAASAFLRDKREKRVTS